jgi:hypothetical protein
MEAIGQGLASGIQSGTQMGLSAKMQQMFEDQAMAKQQSYNAKQNLSLFGNEYGGVDPRIAASVHQQQLEYGNLQALNDAFKELQGEPRDIGFRGPQMARTLPAGEAPMLPYEDMPAEEPIAQPESFKAPSDQIPKQVAKEPLSYEQKVDNLNKWYSANSARLGPKGQKMLQATYNRQLDQLAKEESIAEAKKSRQLKERTTKFSLEAPARETIKKIDDEYNATLKKRPIFKIMESKAPEVQPLSVLRRYFTERFDLPIGALLNPTEQSLEKISNMLLRGIGSDFKGRILQSEVDTYLKSNPGLFNTPEGMQKLAKISMALDDIAEKRWDLKNKIVKQYKKAGEILPEDLDTQILEKSSEFASDAYKKVEDIMNVKGLEKNMEELIPVVGPDGKNYKLPMKFLEKAESEGYKRR